MKKILILGALALAVSASGAMAKSKSGSVTLDGFCDTFTVTVDGTSDGINSTGTGCDDGFGGGYVGKVAKLGKTASVGAVLNGDPSTIWVISFSYPLVTGGTYTFGPTTDGITLNNDFLVGTYTVNAPAGQHKGLKSATSHFQK